MRRHQIVRSLIVSAVLAAGPSTAAHGAIPVPGPNDPLIIALNPPRAQQGRQVLLFGVNFGNVPQVSFNGTPASVLVNRPARGYLAVTVPVGATSGPVTVTNTISALVSNPAEFVVDPGTYTPACTIAGTITAPGPTPWPDSVVVALDVVTEVFVAGAVTDAAGMYSIALPASAAGYEVYVDPPEGDPYLDRPFF